MVTVRKRARAAVSVMRDPAERPGCSGSPSPGTGLPFTVELAASGKTITVRPTQSLLEAMEAAGVDAPYLCRGGACGQCETNVLKCDGTILHRDHWLTPEEQAANTKIMPCVSRFEGKTLVIDR